jgi:hypothetical protein
MTAVKVELPDQTHRRAFALASSQGMSLDQLVVMTLDEVLEQEESLARFRERAASGATVDIDAILAKVPAIEPVREDRLHR